MGKLYVIGVGGTGSRIMQTLIMLLGGGLKINASEIVPMLIDTDVNNGNLNAYKKTARNYSEIHDLAFGETDIQREGHFFHTKLRPSIDLSIDGRQFENLQELIDYNGIVNDNTKRFIDLLFSKENLKMPLEKGFVGNPNIGTVVLNEVINKSADFLKFTQEFAEGDRIFIISSIFGGTGAAGFPLLLKNFRDNNDMANASQIQDAIIGAVTVLPYFSVSKEEALEDEDLTDYEIDSNTFLLKSKAALAYYDRYVSDDINGLYFIGDYKRTTYKSQKGGVKQKNPANFVELAAALSIIDFMNLEPRKSKQSELVNARNFAEFGMNEDVDTIDFKVLHNVEKLTKSLIKNHLFRLYMENGLMKSLEAKNTKWKRDMELSSNFCSSENGLCALLRGFYEDYDEWVQDFKFDQHARKYIPFRSETSTEKNLLTLFNGINPNMKSSFWGGESIPELQFDDFFNVVKDKLDAGTKEQQFMYLMNAGLEDVFTTYFTQKN